MTMNSNKIYPNTPKTDYENQMSTITPNEESNNDQEREREEVDINHGIGAKMSSNNQIEDITDKMHLMTFNPNHLSHSQSKPMPFTKDNPSRAYTEPNIKSPDTLNLLKTQSFTELPQRAPSDELKPNNTPQHPSTCLMGTNSPERQNSSESNNFIANKAKSQQYKCNTNRTNEMESPIFSYYDTSQKYLIESLFQNDENKERSNFIKKHQQQLQPQYDPQSDFGNNNPFINHMNYNFFNQNLIETNSSGNTFAMSPNINQYDDSNNNNANVNANTHGSNFNYFDIKNSNTNKNSNSNLMNNTKPKGYKEKLKQNNNNNDYPNSNYNVQEKFQSKLQYQSESSSEKQSYLNSLYNNKEFFQMNSTQNNTNTNSLNMLNSNSNCEYQNQYNLLNQRFQGSNDNSNYIDYKQNSETEEYIFEKFGKRGWQCEKCNNFNFECK